jgi:chorismate mutase
MTGSASGHGPELGQKCLPQLGNVREQIEQIDQQLVQLIGRRLELAKQAGEAKRALGTFTLDPEREAAVVRRAAQQGRSAGLDEEAIRAVFWQIIGMSRRSQQRAQDGD